MSGGLDEPDPLMRILDLRSGLSGDAFEFRTESGGTIRQYRFTGDEPKIGGFSAVFQVRAGPALFALKIAHRPGSSLERIAQESTSSELQRVIREGGGPVPMMYHFGSVAGVPASLMSWEEGTLLFDLLQQLGRKPRARRSDLGRLSGWIAAVAASMERLARSVAELHGDEGADRFVHGDLKPSNILIRSGRSIREPQLATLLDFGEAALGIPRGPTGYSERYASPELVRRSLDGEAQVDWRSDQYALGRILAEGLDRIERGRGPGGPLRGFGRFARLWEAAERMSSSDPELRFGSWEEVLDAINDRPSRRSGRWIVIAAIVATLLLAVAWVVSDSLAPADGGSVVVRLRGEPGSVQRFALRHQVVCAHKPFKPPPKPASFASGETEVRIPLALELDRVPPAGDTMDFSLRFRPVRGTWSLMRLVDLVREFLDHGLVHVRLAMDGRQSWREAMQAGIDREMEVEGVTVDVAIE